MILPKVSPIPLLPIELPVKIKMYLPSILAEIPAVY
jgi:hypothetical protein